MLWTPEGMNGGNHLYLFLTAYSRRRRTGEPWCVLHRPGMDPWLREFPALSGLLARPEQVGRFQRRSLEWGQQVGRDFLKFEIPRFLDEVLLRGSSFPHRIAQMPQDALVVNVRRGDYYSVPEHRRRYGMDIRGYIRAAVDALPQPLPARVILVSDDPAWCREHLGFLREIGPVQTLPGPHDMFQDLAQLAAARQLILANSTFSYWGGYLATCRPPGERPERIIAPLFFTRQYDDGVSPLLLDQWLALPEDLYDGEIL